MARIAVVGPGSIGGYFAVEAARNGHELVLCARSPFEALTVTQLDGSVRELAVAATTDPDAVDEAEWVWLATKAHQTPAAGAWLRRTCGPSTRAVVVMQNGVEHETRVRPFVGDTPVLPAIVRCGAEAVSPGRIVHHGFSTLEVPEGSLAVGLAALFAGTDAVIEAVDDFTTVAWRKLVSNVTASPMTALTRQRLGVMRRADIQAFATGLAEECLRVGAAHGAALDPAHAAAMVAGVATTNPEMGSSMLYDRLAGRPMEHDALTGAVVRGGAATGIPTPLNAAVLALLSAISDAAT
jgi:2-dehydropantoate 2-reductase